jgi:hypothetical protein
MMCGMPAVTSPSADLLIDTLTRAVAHAVAEMDALAAQRRRLAALADGWQGGHRARYDELLAALERRHVHLMAGVDAGRRALRRAHDEAGR